jgi:CDP-diacylglycerol--glycerol-3-phosphate 3-phosphatidyltransferase
MTAESAASSAGSTGARAADVASGTPVPLLNIANVLTVSRLVLVPVFLVALFVDGGHDSTWRWVATGVFALASITDRVDGEMARRRGLVTDFGKIADPIADKALTGAGLIGLSVLGDLFWWATTTIIARELLVTALRFWVIRYGVIPANRGGKIKTLLQAVAIGVYLIPFGPWAEPIRWVVLGAAVLATVVTGVEYLVQAVRLRAGGGRA